MLRIWEYSGSTPITENVPLLNGLTALRRVLQFGHHVAHQEAFRADVAHVVVVEPDAPARAPAAGLFLGAPGKHDDDVLAELPEPVALADLEAVAHGHDQHHRGDAPGDPRHGQEAAQLVAQQAGDDLAE